MAQRATSWRPRATVRERRVAALWVLWLLACSVAAPRRVVADAEEDEADDAQRALHADEFASLPAELDGMDGMEGLEGLGGIGALGNPGSLGLGGYEDGIGPGEDFGDYEDKYSLADGIRDALRGEEEGGEQSSAEDVVRAGLESDSPAAHMDGVLDVDDVTFAKLQGASAATRWRMLVAAYAPWDKACKEAGFVMRELGRRFAAREDVLVAKADVDRFSKLAARFDVTTYTTSRTHRYPHFLLFEPGNSTARHYDGELTSAALADFALDVARAGVVGGLEALVREFLAHGGRGPREGTLARLETAAAALEREEREDAAYYIKVMGAVLEKGESYIARESERLSSIIQAGSLQPDKLFGFRKRLNVLKVFALHRHDEL